MGSKTPPLLQILSYLDFSRYIIFTLCLDIIYIRSVAKTIYLEKVKTTYNLKWSEYIKAQNNVVRPTLSFRKKNVRQHSPYNVWVRHVSTVHTTRAHLLIKASYHISDTSKTATPTESKVDFHFSLSFPVAELSFLCTCPHKKKYFAYIYIYMCNMHPHKKKIYACPCVNNLRRLRAGRLVS